MLFFTLLSLFTLAIAIPFPQDSSGASTSACDQSCSLNSDQQEAIYSQFAEVLYVQKNVSLAFNTYVSPDLIEHNPQATTIGATIAYLSYLFPLVDTVILHQTFENGIGLMHLGATGSGVPNKTAIADIWRMEGGCIIEHWDVIQTADASTINPIAFF